LKEEALDPTLWRTYFGRGYGPVVRQTAEWIIIFWHLNFYYHIHKISPLIPIISLANLVKKLSPYFFKIQFNIILPIILELHVPFFQLSGGKKMKASEPIILFIKFNALFISLKYIYLNPFIWYIYQTTLLSLQPKISGYLWLFWNTYSIKLSFWPTDTCTHWQ
jgi:hypothetical protein